MSNWAAALPTLLAASSAPPLVKPTREQLCNPQLTFQGMWVDTQQYGRLRWFPPVLGWLDLPQDRQSAYAAHRAAGDTHVNLAVSSQYAEANQQYANIPGRDFFQNLPALKALIAEAIGEGFCVLLMCAGDGEGAGPGYNDPQGMTYGKTWLQNNFQRIWDGLGDVTPWVLACPGYDGCVPGWQPPHTVDPVLLEMRHVIDASAGGGLALELSAGYASWGDGGENWQSPAGKAVDTVLSEFPFPLESNWDQVWQIVARLNQPYNRPLNQPPHDDPNPPFYLAGGTPRGPFYYVKWEFDTYGWVRSTDESTVRWHRQYLQNLGAAKTG